MECGDQSPLSSARRLDLLALSWRELPPVNGCATSAADAKAVTVTALQEFDSSFTRLFVGSSRWPVRPERRGFCFRETTPHAQGFFCKAQNRATVFEDQFQPGALVHLWEVDAAEEQTRNQMTEAISERRVADRIDRFGVSFRDCTKLATRCLFPAALPQSSSSAAYAPSRKAQSPSSVSDEQAVLLSARRS